VLIVFSLHRESLKMILVDDPPSRGGFVTAGLGQGGPEDLTGYGEKSKKIEAGRKKGTG
jgi:hypothetical protein